jgi:hypothetical protein
MGSCCVFSQQTENFFEFHNILLAEKTPHCMCVVWERKNESELEKIHQEPCIDPFLPSSTHPS